MEIVEVTRIMDKGKPEIAILRIRIQEKPDEN
jgi:hypothetical protein